MTQSFHLSDEQLHDLAEGLVDQGAAEDRLAHLDECPECAQRFEHSLDDGNTLVGLARESLQQADPYQNEAGFKRLDQWLATGLAAEGRRKQSLLIDPPSQIAQYKLGTVIGCGGMGTVHQATHVWLHREVALKLMRVDQGIDPKRIQRFTQEFEAIGRLDHPNIVRPFDAGCQSGQAYLAMELVDGLDLGRVRRSVSPMSTDDAAEIIYQAAEGLYHAHQNGIIHRDVKPSNLMLARSSLDGSVSVKVMDLGLVQMESAVYNHFEDHDTVVGTEGYRSPQQQLGQIAETRCDIYSLGATLRVLLLGKTSTSRDESDWLQRGKESGIDCDILDLIGRMTAVLPDQRPSDMQQVMSDLQAFRQQADLHALLSEASADATKNHLPTEADFSWSILSDRKLGQSIDPVADMSTAADRSSNSIRLSSWLLTLGILIGLISFGVWWNSKRNSNTVVPSAISSKAETPVTKPTNAIEQRVDDPDREVVRRTLAMGGRVDIFIGRAIERTLEPTDSIPEKDFMVTWVMAERCDADDEFLDLVSRVEGLTGIVLAYTDVTDKGVAKLGKIKSLEAVFLYHTDVTDVGLAPITKLPKLRELVISETGVTQRTIERLAECKTLRRLAFKDTAITGKSLPTVANITSLRELDIREIDVRDDDLEPILELPNLRDLFINRTDITQKGINRVASIKTLRLLEFDADQASEETAQQLRRQYPKLKVVRDSE